MMHCLSPSILERQSTHIQWQQQNQQEFMNSNFSIDKLLSLNGETICDGCPNFPTISHHQVAMRNEEEMNTSNITTNSNSNSSSQAKGKGNSSKKRKADKLSMDHDEGCKKMKEDSDNSLKSKIEDKKQDYIHVRARRGEATDSHSLAERVRREKISERMKYLQDLVPGCNKVTGKAGMLEEIINYVQSLQRQVEFLSMKLATVNPRLDFNMEALLSKEMNMQCISNVQMPAELVDPNLLHFNSLLDLAMINQNESFIDSCFNKTNAWDNDLHSHFAEPFLSLQGNFLPNNLKREM